MTMSQTARAARDYDSRHRWPGYPQVMLGRVLRPCPESWLDADPIPAAPWLTDAEPAATPGPPPSGERHKVRSERALALAEQGLSAEEISRQARVSLACASRQVRFAARRR